MKRNNLFLFFFLLAIPTLFVFAKQIKKDDDLFVSYSVNPKQQDIRLYWKDDKDKNFKSIQNLNLWLNEHKKKLVFAMNAGMYKQDNSPLGLFIENQKRKSRLNTSSGNGNFYLMPNGIFYITTNNDAVICTTADFKDNEKIKYATQSGPMLLIEGKINSAFKEGSANLNVRNGVGILPDNTLVFAMSKKEISFYDFANYFKALGCSNALYLDGFVSRTYLPEKNWSQLDGDFGVIIGVTAKLNN